MIYFRSQDLHNSGNTVKGTAILYNSLSEDLGNFHEIIRPGAITQDLINRSDIFALLDHDRNYILARNNKGVGSLNLELTEHGLDFSFELPHSYKGEEVRNYLERNEINTCSFAFSLDYSDKDCEKWTRRSDGTALREINKIAGLYDISLVWNAAYTKTSVSLRDLTHEKETIQRLQLYNNYEKLLKSYED